jgi:hypothetical protein
MSEDFWVILVAIGLFVACLYNLLEAHAIMMGRLF